MKRFNLSYVSLDTNVTQKFKGHPGVHRKEMLLYQLKPMEKILIKPQLPDHVLDFDDYLKDLGFPKEAMASLLRRAEKVIGRWIAPKWPDNPITVTANVDQNCMYIVLTNESCTKTARLLIQFQSEPD